MTQKSFFFFPLTKDLNKIWTKKSVSATVQRIPVFPISRWHCPLYISIILYVTTLFSIATTKSSLSLFLSFITILVVMLQHYVHSSSILYHALLNQIFYLTMATYLPMKQCVCLNSVSLSKANILLVRHCLFKPFTDLKESLILSSLNVSHTCSRVVLKRNRKISVALTCTPLFFWSSSRWG